MQELVHLARAVAEEEEAAEEVEAQRREMKARLDGLEKLEKTVSKLTSAMHDTRGELTRCKAAGKEVKALKERIDRQRDERADMEATKLVRRPRRRCRCSAVVVVLAVVLLRCDVCWLPQPLELPFAVAWCGDSSSEADD
jgi:septal ring factor EnvC (AmiA/AmiB activator)